MIGLDELALLKERTEGPSWKKGKLPQYCNPGVSYVVPMVSLEQIRNPLFYSNARKITDSKQLRAPCGTPRPESNDSRCYARC